MKKQFIDGVYFKILFIAFAILAIILPVTGFSLWGDEAMTVRFINQDFASLLSSIINAEGSDAQMPGFLIFLWSWSKLFGISEFALRMANVPFYVFSISLLFTLKATTFFKRGLVFLFLLSPFLWYNLNEARYTIALFSFSLISIISIKNYFDYQADITSPKKWIILSLTAILFGVHFLMLFIFIIIPVMILWYTKFTKSNKKQTLKEWTPYIISFAVLVIPISIYYAYTILNGSGGKRIEPSILNIIFSIYEFLGYNGIGPARNLLREDPSFNIFLPYLPQLLLSGVVYIILFYSGIINLYKNKKIETIQPYLIAIVVCLILFYFASKIVNFQFLGRHLVFLFPFIMFFIWILLHESLISLSKTKKYLIGSLFVMLMMFSCYNVRFNNEYKKENYHEAAIKSRSLNKNNLPILWCGDIDAANYYGLQLTYDTLQIVEPNKVYCLSFAENQDIILGYLRFYLKKQDNYIITIFRRRDYKKKIHDYILEHSYVKVLETKDYYIFEPQRIIN